MFFFLPTIVGVVVAVVMIVYCTVFRLTILIIAKYLHIMYEQYIYYKDITTWDPGGGGALTFGKGRGVWPQNLKPYP